MIDKIHIETLADAITVHKLLKKYHGDCEMIKDDNGDYFLVPRMLLW
jgi:hypothetical protein